jgi:hypothetical protein
MTPDERDGELRRRAGELAREAEAVLSDLGLPALLSALGRVEIVGSAAVGLALTRDIDVDILCRTPDPGAVWDALRPLAPHPRVNKLRWSDARGWLPAMGRADVDFLYYCGVHYYPGAIREAERWKLDLWFYPEGAPGPCVPMRDRLVAATDEERLAILRLKDAAIRAGRYGADAEMQGIHIYEAVLDRGVRRYEDL